LYRAHSIMYKYRQGQAGNRYTTVEVQESCCCFFYWRLNRYSRQLRRGLYRESAALDTNLNKQTQKRKKRESPFGLF
jgi:predicted DNA-binding WGR domain protein